MFTGFLIAVAVAITITLGFAAYNYFYVKRLRPNTRDAGDRRAIQEGARAFISHEYKIITIAALAIAVVLGVVIEWYVGATFLLGTFMSALAVTSA